MRKLVILIGFCVAISAIFGCGSDERLTEQERLLDSIATADSIAWSHALESLLDIPNEAGFIAKFGKSNVVTNNTVGSEDLLSPITIVNIENQTHLEIVWMNTVERTGVISVTQVGAYEWLGDSAVTSSWYSATGVHIGMSYEELQRINGRPFTFSGFGWDYAGSVIDWQGGDLEGKGIAVQLAEAPATLTWTPEQTAQLMGDVEVQSDNPLLKELKPRVWSISVAKVE